MIEVISRGFPGRNSQALLELFDQAVLAENPDVVVLMVGTNDSLNSQALIAPAQYEENLRSLIARIQDCGAAAVVCTILPCDTGELLQRHPKEAYPQENPLLAIERTNETIRRITSELGIACADANREFIEKDYASNNLLRTVENCGQEDGVHPTPEGYVVLGELVTEVIRASGIPATRVVCFGDSITYGVHVQGEGTAQGQAYPAVLKRCLNQQ